MRAARPAQGRWTTAAEDGRRQQEEWQKGWQWRWQWALRLAGAGSLAAMAWIHWHLYEIGFASVPTVGPLFLVNAVLGAAAALSLLLTPARWLALVELGGGLLSLGTLGALFVSLTVGLFGFVETWEAPLIAETIAVEAAGSVLLLAGAALHRRRRAALTSDGS